jgi:hypothetical protein
MTVQEHLNELFSRMSNTVQVLSLQLSNGFQVSIGLTFQLTSVDRARLADVHRASNSFKSGYFETS